MSQSQYKAIKHESMKLKPVTALDGLTLSDKLACLSAQAVSSYKAVCEQGLGEADWHFVNTVLAFHLTPETEGLLCCFGWQMGCLSCYFSGSYFIYVPVCAALFRCFHDPKNLIYSTHECWWKIHLTLRLKHTVSH